MKTRVMKIDRLSFPPGTLHLGPCGWVIDKEEEITVRANIPLERFAEQMVAAHSGLLGPGELVFAMFDICGKPTHLANTLDYRGHIVFLPSPDENPVPGP